MSPMRVLAAGQGAFYVATGVWPLLTRRSFEAVTGRKTDWWLVQTVGVLVTAIGASLASASAADRVNAETRRLAVWSALGLAAIDVVHASRGRISKVYLLDAAGELALAAAWLTLARLGEPRVCEPFHDESPSDDEQTILPREERRWSDAPLGTGGEQPR